MTTTPINYFALEQESAEYRIENEIGVLHLWNEDGSYRGREFTPEYAQLVKIWRHSVKHF